jgi:hypothetical protein
LIKKALKRILVFSAALAFIGPALNAATATGLIFPSNGSPTVRFLFSGGNLIPFYPATYIWRVRPVQQSGYYTTFFWGPAGAFTGEGFYGAHPYPAPPPSGSAHKWEISANGNDFVEGDGGVDTTVVKGRWFTQAFVVRNSGGNSLEMKFYWDLPDTSKVTTVVIDDYTDVGNTPRVLTWGDAPWSPGNELLSGTLRAIQFYSTNLSLADILIESANDSLNVPQTAAGAASVWYMNQNPTPVDIADKSNAGHNPAWFNANRPALYTEVIGGELPLFRPRRLNAR